MFLLALIWILIGAAVGWRLGSRRSASRALAQARQQMRQETRYWQELAERSKIRADQLAQENEAWAAGYKQGREDVIKIVPHIAAQRGLPGQSVASESDEMNNCA
jgi:Tfp pilus assembly protein FimV